jgi:hypothetical protein
MKSVLLSIQSLLAEPNPDDPLNNQAAEEWKTNKKAAEAKAKEFTIKYAKWSSNHQYMLQSKIYTKNEGQANKHLPSASFISIKTKTLHMIIYMLGLLLPILPSYFFTSLLPPHDYFCLRIHMNGEVNIHFISSWITDESLIKTYPGWIIYNTY